MVDLHANGSQLGSTITIIIAWVGFWGMTETLVDVVSPDHRWIRFACYLALAFIGIAYIMFCPSQNKLIS